MGDTPETATPAPAAAPVDDGVAPDMEAIVAELDAADAAQAPAGNAETETSEVVTPPPVAAKPPETADLDAARARRLLREAEKKERGAALSLQDFKAKLAARLRDDPDAALSELGVSADDIIDAKVAGRGNAAKPKTPEERIEALERELAESRVNSENARLDAQLEGAKASTREKLAGLGADKYPRLNCANAEKAAQRREVAIDFMLAYHAKHGVPLSVEKAAQLTNDYFDDGPAAASAAALPASAPRAAAPTLTNAGRGGSAPAGDEDEGDEDARYQRALADINRM